MPINCAALPEPLLESEMFGHRKGAFTGADRDKPGLLETANGGTLFLDELTEMSLPLQAKLLRVVQDGVVRRVGAETAGDPVDVRFISATNRDPQEAVERGVLRGDLFYRLRVVPITLPPLRKRVEDIRACSPIISSASSGTAIARCRIARPRLSEASIEFLRSRPWRGNVRELQNVIEHVAVLVEPDQLIEPGDIPDVRRRRSARRSGRPRRNSTGRSMTSRTGSSRSSSGTTSPGWWLAPRATCPRRRAWPTSTGRRSTG